MCLYLFLCSDSKANRPHCLVAQIRPNSTLWFFASNKRDEHAVASLEKKGEREKTTTLISSIAAEFYRIEDLRIIWFTL